MKAFIINYKMILLMLVCSIISPLISLPLSIFLLINSDTKKEKIIYTMFICFSLAYLALHTLPAESDDLYRHYLNMDVLNKTSFINIFSSSYFGVYLNTLIMYLCSLTGVYGLYPALYIGVGYFLIIYNMIKMNIDKRKCIEFVLLIFFVFFCINFRDFISGLRNYFSFIVCAYTIIDYYFFSNNKMKCYLMMFLMGFIHTSSFVILFIFIIIENINNSLFKKLIYILTFLFVPGTIFAITIFWKIFPTMQNNDFINKIFNYFTTPNIYNVKSYIFLVGIVVLSIICHYINRKYEDVKFKKYNNFIGYYLCFLTAVSPIMLLLSRFLFLLVPLTPYILIQTMDILKKRYKICLYIILICFILAGILFLISSIRAYPWDFDVNIFFIICNLR